MSLVRQGVGDSMEPSHRPRAPRVGFLALIATGLVHLAVVVSIGLQPFDVNDAPPEERSLIWSLHNDTVHRRGPAADLFGLYHAALQMRRGHSPYERPVAPEAIPYHNAFRYLPIVADTIGRCLITLTPRAAYIAWLCLLELTLAAVCAFLFLRAPDVRLRWAGPCLLLLSSPYFLELHMGQFTFVTTVLLVAALFLCEQRTGWAAVCYATAVVLKAFPLIALPALLRKKGGRLCIAAAAVVLLAVAVPYFWIHPRWWREFVLMNLAAHIKGQDSGNFGFIHLVYLAGQDLVGGWTLTHWKAATLAAQALFIGPAALAVFFSRERSTLIGGAVLYLAFLLSFSDVWEHHMSGAVVIGLALLWGLDAAHADRAWTWAAWLAVLGLALPTPFRLFDHAIDPAVYDPSVTWPHAARYLVPFSKAGPVLMLYVISLRTLLRAGFERSPVRASASLSADP